MSIMAHLKRWVGKQRGFSLVEALVTVSVIGVLGSAAAGFTYHMTQVAAYGSGRLVVEADMRTAMQWLARDARMSHTTSLTDGGATVSCAALTPSTCLTLTWTDEWEEASTDYTVTYALVGTELRRTHNGTTHVIARNVTDLTATLATKRVTATLSASSEGITNSVTHYFYLISLQES